MRIITCVYIYIFILGLYKDNGKEDVSYCTGSEFTEPGLV